MSFAALGVGGTIAAGAAVAGAGASIYSASQAGGGAPAPATMSPKKSILSYIKGVSAGMPMLLDTEDEYRKQFGQLNIDDQQQYLNALLGLGGTATNTAGQQLQAARQQEYGNMLGNAGSVMQLLGGVNPNGQAAAQRATTMADDAYNRSLSISPQEARASDQQAREAFGARGRINDNVSVVGELLGREDVMAGKREEAQMANANAFSLAGQFSSPALQLLMGTPSNMALGQDYLANSQGIIGKNTPQLLNPDAGINMGMQNAANLNSYNMANAASQQNSAAMWGQMGSSLLGLAGNYFKTA
jgi:hypothetical protein